MIDIANIVSRLDVSAPMRWLLALLPGPLRRTVERHLSLIYALLLHVIILGVFVVGVDWSDQPTPSQAKVNVIAATVVDGAQLQAKIDKLKKAKTERQSQQDARQRQLEKDKQQRIELQRKKVVEERRLQERKKQRQIEKTKAKALVVKKKAEQEKRDKLKKQQAAIKKEQQAQEKKRKVEQKRRAELEKKRKAEAERKKKLEQKKKREAQQRREAEQSLQRQLEAEQTAETLRQTNRVVNQYVEIIKQKVTRNWLRPPSAREGLSCIVAVRLIPGGEVLTARVIKSSGDSVFDRSVESAVLKASPLPLPSDGSMFERFRELEFVFSPEG